MTHYVIALVIAGIAPCVRKRWHARAQNCSGMGGRPMTKFEILKFLTSNGAFSSH